MLETVKAISGDVSRSQAIDSLSANDQSLKGAILSKNIDKESIDSLFSQLGYTQPYIRNLSLGHSLSTYTSWSEYKSEAGYSIFQYPVSNFEDGISNLLLVDDKPFTYMGQASSLASTAFDSVLTVEGTCITDVTTEAGSEIGTQFTFISDMDGNTSYLYCGSCAIFDSIDISLETIGSNYDLQWEIYNGGCWVMWDSSCDLSVFNDETLNLINNGRISWENSGNSWTPTTYNSSYNYWGRLSSSTTPIVPAAAYHITPGDSVVGLLAMSQTQYLNEEWLWAYWNGYIFCTIRNDGSNFYEGDYFIKGSSSIANKRNYFTYNHEFVISYKNSAATATSYMKVPTWTVSSRPTTPENGMMAYNSDIGQVEIYINGEYRTMA